MNQHWKNFLLNQDAHFEGDTLITFPTALYSGSDNTIYPITHLAILKIDGNDAAKLLQGQVTCNINDITETQSSPGALCTPKGRAITTFLLTKTNDAFLMVLPRELLETVKKRLQMYILRSAVTLTDCSEQLCLIGLLQANNPDNKLFSTSQQDSLSITIDNAPNRQLIITEVDQAITLWSDRVTHQGFIPAPSEQWRYLDILAGLPWLTSETSEEFIPQMLNLDQLGGISYNKGCYTGQEIVARTHYLGKAKRALCLAECDTNLIPLPNSAIVNTDPSNTEQTSTKILLAMRSPITSENEKASVKMLIVLQLAENNNYNLVLADDNQSHVTLLTPPL